MSAEYVYVPRDALKKLVEDARHWALVVDGEYIKKGAQTGVVQEFEALVEALGVEDL